jgi:bifunctional UDP-N-acetylglucosamine pyrophosphorylase/glucosamine-1-phosphate N-acetyltransferase
VIPKELQVRYYFKDLNSCPIRKAFSNTKYVWDALEKKDKILNFEHSVLKGRVSDKSVIENHVMIDKKTIVDPFVFNCTIRSGALIRPFTIIGDNCVIGHNVEIKNSIVFDYAKISTNSFLGDSIIGKGGRTGSGVITGNRRFDQNKIVFRFAASKYETEFEKFGCVLGDYSRLGANAVTAPGTLIGPFSWIYGLSSIRGFVKERTLVKLRQGFESIEKDEWILEYLDREGNI